MVCRFADKKLFEHPFAGIPEKQGAMYELIVPLKCCNEQHHCHSMMVLGTREACEQAYDSMGKPKSGWSLRELDVPPERKSLKERILNLFKWSSK